MEAGDAELKKTLGSYLKYFIEARKGDDKAGARGGSKLEHIYVDTFHQLKIKEIEAKWKEHVVGLAKKCGVEWTLPDTPEEREKWGLPKKDAEKKKPRKAE